MEKVHFQLESTLPELLDLEQKGLFTRQELRQITLKRTKHESALIKRSGKPEDYLKYAEYEIGLERLRRMRWKRLKLDLSPQPRSISSHSIPRRILYILRRATEKFPTDLRCWLARVDYAKSEGMGKVVVAALTAALQLHPLEPVLYILLSQHYLDPLPPSHKRSTASSTPTTSSSSSSTFSIENIPPARKTLLLGLRFLPENRDLWVEYIKLEVGWVEALRRRWRVLGILDEVERGVKKEVEVEGGEGFQLDPPTNDGDDADDDERDTGKGAFGESGESARKQLVDGQLVLTVLNNSFARPGLRNDLGYRLRLIQLFRGYPTGLRDKLLRCVYGDMMQSPGLRRDCTARRVVLESGLFDRVYDPEVDEREVGVKLVHPVEGESERIAVEGEEKVKVISRVVKALKADQEDVEGELVGEERERWRAAWDEVVGDWILRWAGRMREDENDLRKFLLASMTSLTKGSSSTPTAHLLASHLAYLVSLSSDKRPSLSKLQTMAKEYTVIRPSSPEIWSSRLEIERIGVDAASTAEERQAREAEVGRLYLSAMDSIGCAAGSVRIWVDGLRWFDRFTGAGPKDQVISAHWTSGLKSAKRFLGDGEHGRALYSGVMVGWVESVLVGDEESSQASIDAVKRVVDLVLQPDWTAPAIALQSTFGVVTSLRHLRDDDLAPILRTMYETWHRRARHDPEQKVLGVLTYVDWLLKHTKGQAKKAWDLVETVKKEVETGEAGGLEGKGGLLRRDQKTIERERREMGARLEEGWREILTSVERRRDQDGESDDGSESGSGSDSSDEEDEEDEDVEME